MGWGKHFGGAPPPHVPGRPGPPPSLGAAAPKALRGRAGGPERQSRPWDWGGGPRGEEGAAGGPQRGRGGGRGRPRTSRCPLGFPGPPPASVPLSLSAAALPRPEGSRGGVPGVAPGAVGGPRAPPSARHRHGLAPPQLCSGKWAPPPRPSGTPVRASRDAQSPPGAPPGAAPAPLVRARPRRLLLLRLQPRQQYLPRPPQ